MDIKKTKKYETLDRKCFNDKVRDRGDLKTVVTKNDCKIKKENLNNNKTYPDGDSKKISALQRPEKPKPNITSRLPVNECKAKPKIIPDVEKELLCKRLAYLKRIRDRYTTRLKPHTPCVPTNPVKKEEPKSIVVKLDHTVAKDTVKPPPAGDTPKRFIEVVTQTKEKEKDSTNGSDAIKDKKEQMTQRKKPIIKTIMTKHDTTRVYKAVTFGEQKQKPTLLQIKIPNDALQKNVKVAELTPLKSKLTVSRVSVHEKIEDVRKKKTRKRDRRYRHVPSRDGSFGGSKSPPTEVARWAPSSIDKHTKPYYEAWVNTTLAAISKSKNRERLLNDEKFMLQSFRKAFQRPDTPELFYKNFTDERYTGRIKITQR